MAPSSYKLIAKDLQTMIGTSKMLRLGTMFGISWAMCTWLFVAYPFQDSFPVFDQTIFEPPQVSKAWDRTVAVEPDESFSACLLVMDDNHFLIEWLAYHYFALPLRRLIVGVDPRSETSPSPILHRWHDKIEITEWHDDDYMSKEEVREAERAVRNQFGNLTAVMARHRARQRIFYYKCMKQLKQEGKSWTLMIDTDEFLRINQDTAQALELSLPPANEPAAIRTSLQAELQRPGTNFTKSPCIQIPRLRFGTKESSSSEIPIPQGYDPNDFLTQRWRKHAGPDQHWANRISKAMIDLSQVQWTELQPVDSIHRPIKSLCSQRRLHIRAPESMLAINHYLGSWEQYEYRNDARVTDPTVGDLRSRQQYNKQMIVDMNTNDDIRPWLQGFVQTMGDSQARLLLSHVGKLEPKPANLTNVFLPKMASNERCAILFFGLPRSFRHLVLPSIEKNLLQPNARYNCDYFVHFYNRTEEPSGRANNGGKLDPTEIFLLQDSVQNVAASTFYKINNEQPVVEFHADTEDDFWAQRKSEVDRYQNTKGKDGKYLYFPWKALTYEYPSSLHNIVRQWHSINGAWELMEESANQRGIHYTRVGMFRSDVLYVTPIDIYETEIGTYDTKNNQAVLAPFGAMPVNDRMFYGPYEAVAIWATKRFSSLESYVHTCEPGWAMHSEKFLAGSIMPAIRELGIAVVVDPDICFLRARADFSAVTTDCHLLGQTRGFKQAQMRSKVEQVLGRRCSSPHLVTRSHLAVRCEPPEIVASD